MVPRDLPFVSGSQRANTKESPVHQHRGVGDAVFDEEFLLGEEEILDLHLGAPGTGVGIISSMAYQGIPKSLDGDAVIEAALV